MSTDGLDASRHVAQTLPRERDSLSPRPLLALIAACGALIAVLYLAFVQTSTGQRIDQRAMDHRALATRPARYAIHDLLTTISAGMLVVVIAVLVGQALVRRRPALALVAVATIAGAALCTELLKHGLTRPDLYFFSDPEGNTFPSGHTTVAFSVGIAALLVVPSRLRGIVALGAIAYGAAVGIAVVAAGWHRPSDVAGAYLVVVGWGALVAFATARRFPRAFAAEAPSERPLLQSSHLAIVGVALAAGYVAALVAVLARHGGAIDWTLPGGTFLSACVALVALAALTTVALLIALRRALPDAR
ncbi:MAG TPA: phosphatase PAP2 family protein [Conexibacter sp.]|nr:phosphatase PAP2 family protein [Conexibacter sp.]